MADSAVREPTTGVPRLLGGHPFDAMLFAELEDGTRIAIRNDLRRMTSYVVAEQRRWFEFEWDLLPRLVRPGDTVFDVGANHGVYALSLARRVGPEGRVVAFEPGDDPASLLDAAARFQELRQLDLRRVAVAERDRDILFYQGRNTELARTGDGEGGREVPGVRLDTVWRELGRPDPALLKVDVEGAEAQVFAGAEEMLAATSPLVMFEISACARAATRLHDMLQPHGFSFYRYRPALDLLTPFSPERIDPFDVNVLAMKAETARRLEERGLLVAAAGPAGTLSSIEEAEGVSVELLAGSASGSSEAAAMRLERAQAALARIELHLAEDRGADAYAWRALAYRLAQALARSRDALRHFKEARMEVVRCGVARWPALPMSPWLAAEDPREDPGAWMQMDFFDRILSGHSWSSYFLPARCLERLELLRGNPFFPPHLERRRQLQRVVQGWQPCPEGGEFDSSLRPAEPVA